MTIEPRFRQLARENLLTAPTLAALERREAPLTGDPRFFDADAFSTLVAVCERLRPPYDRPTAREIALGIDAQLADGRTDGWRYDAMPPDGEAHRMGLAALEAEARAQGGSFAELADPDDFLRALQRGETRLDWGVPPRRFMEDLMAEVATLVYSQPVVQDAIGYDGYADAQGWNHLSIGDAKESWE